MRTYCKECQPALGALVRVHLCPYHAATHDALLLVRDISHWPMPLGMVGGSDKREHARDIMASIAKDVLSRIGQPEHAPEALPPVTSVWLVHLGNYWPREIDSLWLTRAKAEQRASVLISGRGDWRTEEMRIGLEETLIRFTL